MNFQTRMTFETQINIGPRDHHEPVDRIVMEWNASVPVEGVWFRAIAGYHDDVDVIIAACAYNEQDVAAWAQRVIGAYEHARPV